MKSKTIYQIPDSYYNYFGIYVSGAGSPGGEAAPPGLAGKFFSESERIGTLARESRYKSYFPVLKKINLLSIHYPSLPLDSGQRAAYVKKIIKSSIKRVLSSASTDGNPSRSCLDYAVNCFNLNPGSVSIEICSRDEDAAAGLACSVLGGDEAMRITFLKLDSLTVYASPVSNKKIKFGHYHMRSDPSVKAHVIDLASLLTDASVINALYETLACSSIPLVQNVYERFAANIGQRPDRTAEESQLLESIHMKNAVPYECLFHFCHRGKDPLPIEGMASRLSSILYGLFCEILEIFQDISQENSYREQMTRNIATAYITKKHIPESVLDAMKRTGFLHYFKYVEFDEDTDLASVSAIEKEFEAINKAYFSGSVFPDVKVRFRKLGKHKASGLYYPSLDTLCVDIRSPSSFMHEYFHMIDNQLGDLSLEPGFQEIVEQYKKAFLEGLELEPAAVKQKMGGRSKYNIGYFFRRAEIFARCGEIYLMRILKAESSLLQPSLGLAYPESETLDSLVRDYYKALLQEKLAYSVFARAC